MRLQYRPERSPHDGVPAGGRREGQDTRGGKAGPRMVSGGGQASEACG